MPRQLSDLISDWVKTKHPDEWQDDLTWTINESGGEAYHYSEQTNSDGYYDAEAVGSLGGKAKVKIVICDQEGLQTGTFNLQAFLAELFQVAEAVQNA